MTANETILHDALAKVIPAYHLILDGRPDKAAAFRTSGERSIYESGVPILTWELFEVNIYQREYDRAVINTVRAAVEAAGFSITMTGQIMEDEYYRDELRLQKRKQED